MRVDNAVEQGNPHENAEIEPEFPYALIVVEQELSQGQVTVEQDLANTSDVARQKSSRERVMVE